ncbi:MAG TPA: ROK family protein, partial [Methylomirabilota bacterium]|nr:ROK family protein [Methylomirabilota bacterium]
MNANGVYFGIDLGGSSVKSVVVTEGGNVLSQRQADHDPDTRLDWSVKIREVYQRWVKEFGLPAGVGLSAPGLAGRNGRSIAHMPGRLDGIEGFDFTDFLKPPKPVPVCNDAHAALLGESWAGAAKGYDSVIMLTLGTGVGGAAIVNGRMLCGRIGRAGHFGHTSLDPFGAPDICNCPGSLERVIGNCTV